MMDLRQAILAVDNGYSLIESRLLARVLNSGTVKIVPVKSEIIQNTSKSVRGESALIDDDDLNHHESDEILLNRDKVAENTANELSKDNLTDVVTTSASVQSETEATQEINTVRDATPQEQNETVSKLETQSSNLDEASNIVQINDSNSSDSVSESTINSLNISTSEQKSNAQLDSTNSSSKPQEKVDTPLANQTKLQAYKQNVNSSSLYNLNLDEPSYNAQIGPNQVGLNMAKREDEKAIFPIGLTAKLRKSSKTFFKSNISYSKTKLGVTKNYLDKINKRSEIQRIKAQTVNFFQPISLKFSLYSEQYIKPLFSKYKPFANKYKSRFLNLISKRSTQRTLSNLVLMIFGGLIVLLIYSL